MSDSTPRLKLGELVQMQEMDAATINEALVQLDAFIDACFKGEFINTPPTSPQGLLAFGILGRLMRQQKR